MWRRTLTRTRPTRCGRSPPREAPPRAPAHRGGAAAAAAFVLLRRVGGGCVRRPTMSRALPPPSSFCSACIRARCAAGEGVVEGGVWRRGRQGLDGRGRWLTPVGPLGYSSSRQRSCHARIILHKLPVRSRSETLSSPNQRARTGNGDGVTSFPTRMGYSLSPLL